MRGSLRSWQHPRRTRKIHVARVGDIGYERRIAPLAVIDERRARTAGGLDKSGPPATHEWLATHQACICLMQRSGILAYVGLCALWQVRDGPVLRFPGEFRNGHLASVARAGAAVTRVTADNASSRWIICPATTCGESFSRTSCAARAPIRAANSGSSASRRMHAAA